MSLKLKECPEEPEARELSDRERTVLLLAAEGLTDKEIAKNLRLSQRTIGTYWERMRTKIGHFSRTQLVARFIRDNQNFGESANYRSLFATWEDGVWILSPEGKTFYCNYRVAELFDMTSEEMKDVSALDIIRKKSKGDIDGKLPEVLLASQNIEFNITKKNGVRVYISMQSSVLSNGKPGASAIILRLTDVSVQKRVKHTLDSCESSLKFVSDYSSDLIARFDLNLRCISINPSFEKIVGKEAEMVGRKITELDTILLPAAAWHDCVTLAIKSGETQVFRSAIPGLPPGLETHVLPLPAEDCRTAEIMTITAIPLIVRN